MASEIDIANLALAHLGDDASVASIDPPEGSSQAEHCARFYPIARDSMLESHDWNFTIRRKTLAQLDVSSFNRQFAYQKPADAIRIIQVLPAASSTENDGVEYELSNTEDGTELILTDLEDATVRYTTRVSDTTKFSPLFVDALSWLLAAHLAGPVIKGDMGIAEAKRATQMYLLLLSEAKRSDANQRNAPPEHTPEWVSGRGQANPYLFDAKISR